MKDFTEIDHEGQFARSIREYFEEFRPKKIMETGLYHGMGSTRVIASCIVDLNLLSADFYSIECSNHCVNVAKENLRHGGLYSQVAIVEGLSIPESLLPSEIDICKRIIKAKEAGMTIDHQQDPANAASYYRKETEKFHRDDRIGDVMSLFNGRPDFVLLDSAAHIGKIEFDYLLLHLESPCGIALDDTNHLKHFESAELMKNDDRFEILAENSEKFGSILAKFTP